MLKIFFMQNIYLEILLIIFIFSKKMYCEFLCQRCCGEKEYIRMEKVFGDAIENGAADDAIDNLNNDISAIQGIFVSNEILSNLKDYFTTKKNSLPETKQSRNFTDNRERLNAANNSFIINEVIVILKTCYKNYNSFLVNNENNTFTAQNFSDYFKIFLKLCGLMIKESLENYRFVEGNDEIRQIVSDLKENNNPFKINNINVEKKEYEVEDTTELRNKIGYLFTIFFGKLIKYRLGKDFNKKALEINDDNVTDEEIKKIDGLSI